MGNGFKVGQLPLDQFPTLLLFATGSGIAPVKALIESEDLQVFLLFVCTTRPHTPQCADAIVQMQVSLHQNCLNMDGCFTPRTS